MRRGIALAVAVVLAVVMAAEAAPVAPAFRARLLDTSATLDSRDLLGKRVVVVRFQASWCRPCARETDALSRLAERYRGRGVEVIAFHVQDTAADTRRFMRAHGVSHVMVVDSGENEPLGVVSTLDVAGIVAWGEA